MRRKVSREDVTLGDKKEKTVYKTFKIMKVEQETCNSSENYETKTFITVMTLEMDQNASKITIRMVLMVLIPVHKMSLLVVFYTSNAFTNRKLYVFGFLGFSKNYSIFGSLLILFQVVASCPKE